MTVRARLAATATLVLLMSSFAIGRDGGGEPAGTPVLAADVVGSLSLLNSRGSGAIFSATGLAPGRSVAGEVALVNTGSVSGALALKGGGLSETPGQGGGLLSQRLQLVVLDLSGPSTIYTGPLAAFGTQALGNIGPGATRSFKFTATLPDAGTPLGATAGDNAYQGASVTTSYVWSATASEIPGGGAVGGAPDSKLALRVRLVRRQPPLQRRQLVLYVRCSKPCTVTARAKGAKRVGGSKAARKANVQPNRSAKLTLRLSRRTARKLARAVARRRGARLTLSVKARDAANHTAAFTHGMDLVQVRRGGRNQVRARWSKAKKPKRLRAKK